MKKIPVRNINVPPAETATGFRVQSLNAVLRGKDMTQELHRHEYFYLLFIEKGKGNHEIDFVSYPIANGTVFLMRPGQVHQLTLHRGSTGYMLQFTADFFHAHDRLTHQSLSRASAVNHYKLTKTGLGKIRDVFRVINDESNNQSEGYIDVIKLQLSILFIALTRLKTAAHKTSNPYAVERLREFMQLLETNAVANKQPSFYADRMNLSAYQLNTITKETLGKTSSEVIQEYLILESKRYLLATASQVNQIGYELGFDDPSYFIRFFKKHTGYSPEAFRERFA